MLILSEPTGKLADIDSYYHYVNTNLNPTYKDELKLLGWDYISYEGGWPYLSYK